MRSKQLNKSKLKSAMRTGSRLHWLMVILCMLAAISNATGTEVVLADPKTQLPAFVPGELLVKFRPEVRQEAAAAYQYWFDIATRRTFAINGYQQVRLPAGVDVEEALELYLEDPDVEHAEPNYIVSANIIPDDTYFNRLWGLRNTGQNVNGTNGSSDADIDAPAAWNVTTGSADIVVAVIDSGVDVNHPDLQDNMWVNLGEIADNGIDDDGNGYVDDVNGWDFLINDKDPRDAHGHGTHVAGIIAAVGNNNTGVAGISWSAKIMVLRFLDAWGFGSTANAIAAIEYATDNGADIINNSWGGGGFVQALKDAIDESDAVVVCAAGNSGLNTDNFSHYPSSYASANIIAVAASDQDDQLAWFSNYGSDSVDVAAPGTNIYSTAPGREAIWQDNFDDGNINGWTTGGTNNRWNSTNEEAFSGTYALTDSPSANYKNNTNSWVYTPELNLANRTASKLEFKIYGNVKSGADAMLIEASTNKSTWNLIYFQLASDPNVYSGLSGPFASWTTVTADLEAYDGRSRVWVRFSFVTDGSTVADGYYIDDVKVTTASTDYSGTEYTYKQGTSMATPHVAGLAALILAQNPALNNLQVKALIEDSVDSKPDLIGKVASNGRINAATALADPPSIVPFPSINFAADVITVVYDEEGMLGAKAENRYSFSPSMNFSSVNPNNDDITHLGGSMYQLSMASIPAYEIFTLTVSGITDLMGNAVTPASITINDDDGDDMADDWETENGLNPNVDDSAADTDRDGYSNIEEYEARTNPRSSAEAPLVIQDTIPEHAAGISDGQRVPYNTTVAVLLASAYGIDTTDHTSVKFTITDGVNPSYTRNLSDDTVRFINLTADPETQVTRMWVVYDRSEESDPLQNFPYDSHVKVKIDAADRLAKYTIKSSFEFKVETQIQSAEAWAADNLPDSDTVAADDPDLGGGLDDGIEVISGDLLGAKIIFNSSELQTPQFGPMGEIPPVTGARGVGIPMNLQPPAVFDNPVKILIPCPDVEDVSRLSVYYYDGNSWVLAVDAAGNVQAGGDGLVLPGSRVNHNDTNPATIEIRIYHFSGFQAGIPPVSSGSSSAGGGGGGGGGVGCFITAATGVSVLGHLIFLTLFGLLLAWLCIHTFNKIMWRR